MNCTILGFRKVLLPRSVSSISFPALLLDRRAPEPRASAYGPVL